MPAASEVVFHGRSWVPGWNWRSASVWTRRPWTSYTSTRTVPERGSWNRTVEVAAAGFGKL